MMQSGPSHPEEDESLADDSGTALGEVNSFDEDSTTEAYYPQSSVLDVSAELNHREQEKKLALELQVIALEREKSEFHQQKKLWEIEIRQKDLDLERRRMGIEEALQNSKTKRKELVKDGESRRLTSTFNQYLKCFASVLLLGAGIVFTLKGDNLGPYIMGTGAAGAGIESTHLLKGDKKKDEEDEVIDSD